MSLPRRFLPSISSLRALEALDRLGSASAAAADLNVTQGAISRQLQALEGQTGANLVERDGKRLALTPMGARYAAEIRDALQLIAEATLGLEADQLGGTVNLAILPSFGMRWLVPRLPDFAKRHPDVTLNMSTRLERFDFARDPFDAAIQFGVEDWPGTDHLLLKHETLVAVAAPDMLGHEKITQPSDLLSLPLLHIRTRPQAWQDWFLYHEVDVTGALPGTIYDQFSTIIQAACHGLGLALLPDYLVVEELATRRLAPVWGRPVEAEGGYHLIWPMSRRHAPALKKFRTWLATQAEPEDPLPR